MHLIADIGVLELSGSQPKGDVFKQREVREENVVLEDQDYGIPVGWFFVKEDFAPVGTLNSGYEFKRVVLSAPEGPIIETISPNSTVKLMLLRTSFVPYLLERF